MIDRVDAGPENMRFTFYFQVLYTRIAYGLWRSSRQFERNLNASFSKPSSMRVRHYNRKALANGTNGRHEVIKFPAKFSGL